jgi:hypothetical protein
VLDIPSILSAISKNLFFCLHKNNSVLIIAMCNIYFWREDKTYTIPSHKSVSIENKNIPPLTFALELLIPSCSAADKLLRIRSFVTGADFNFLTGGLGGSFPILLVFEFPC